MNNKDLDKQISDVFYINNSGTKYKLSTEWDLWYHKEKNNWKISGYKKLWTIKNLKDYWDVDKCIKEFNVLSRHHFFLMRKNILPIWEDKNNRFGGTWSFRISSDKMENLWSRLSMYMIGETLTNQPYEINGISVCLKNPSISVIKIWNRNKKKKSINLLPKDIINDYGYNIIYKINIPEYN